MAKKKQELTVESVFKKWLKFMHDNGPGAIDEGRPGLDGDDFEELRHKIKAELIKAEEDDERFYAAMGGGMS